MNDREQADKTCIMSMMIILLLAYVSEEVSTRKYKVSQCSNAKETELEETDNNTLIKPHNWIEI